MTIDFRLSTLAVCTFSQVMFQQILGKHSTVMHLSLYAIADGTILGLRNVVTSMIIRGWFYNWT